MKSAFLLMMFVLFPAIGLAAPFVTGLGYVWVDFTRPQDASYGDLKGLPLSFIIFIVTFLSYILLDRKHVPKLNPGFILLFLFAVWISLTTLWAETPVHAAVKWDWAFKGICFGMFFPFLFRSRVQIEAALAIITFSVASLYIAYGLVTFVSGGGYGTLTRSNKSISESSTIAMVSIMMIPINLYFYKYSLIFKPTLINKMTFIVLSILCVATSIGTFARTGLISGAVLAALMILGRKKHKVSIALLLILLCATVYTFAPDAWLSRMDTIDSSTETMDNSALGRLAVWTWTLDYVSSHPFGGGFDVYRINSGEYFGLVLNGKAFHSAYFEVLGEQGYVGLQIYLLIYLWVLLTLNSIRKRTKDNEKAKWLFMLSKYLMMFFLVYSAGSAFIGVAFQPLFYYVVGITICLQQYVRRVTTKQTQKSVIAPQSYANYP